MFQNAHTNFRKWRRQNENQGVEESDHHDFKWRKDAEHFDDRHPFCHAVARSHHQEALACILGSCTQVLRRWQDVA